MRDAAINLRALPQQRDLIDQAAQLLGKTRSDFMLEAACDKAQSVLLEQVLFSPSRIIRFSAFKQPAKRDGAVVRRQFSLPVSEFPFSTHSEAQKSRAQKGPRP